MNDGIEPAPEASAIVFDVFQPGSCLGSISMSVDRIMLENWIRLYGPRSESNVLPLAFAPLLLMRAMLAIVSPRPPGNIHVGQTYSIHRMPRIGDALTASVWCSEKELRRGRRIVKLQIRLVDPKETMPLVSGCSTMFWAI
jgi:hypothetical protein